MSAQLERPEVRFDQPYPIERSDPGLNAYIMIERDSAELRNIYSLQYVKRELREVRTLPPRGKFDNPLPQVAPNGNAVYTAMNPKYTGYYGSTYDGEVIALGGKRRVVIPSMRLRQVTGYSGENDTERVVMAHIPDAYLSPRGDKILLIDNCFFDVIDSSYGVVKNRVWLAEFTFGEDSCQVIRIDTLLIDGFGANGEYYREVLRYSFSHPEQVYMDDYYPGQLWSSHTRLRSLDLTDGSSVSVDSVCEHFLSSSLDDRFIVYENDDETCCGGSNYTDNRVIMYDRKTKKRILFYDEYDTYRNKGKQEDYPPLHAALSPDNQSIAMTILGGDTANHYDVVLLMSTDGESKKAISGRQFLGWLTNTEILVSPNQQNDESVRTKYKPRLLYSRNIVTMEEHALFPDPVIFLDISWQ